MSHLKYPNWKILFFAILCLAQITLYQNCGEFRSAESGFFSLSHTDEFAAAQKILAAKCVSCHSVGGSASHAPLDHAQENKFVESGLVVPGRPEESKLLFRLKNFPDESRSGRNMPPDSDFSQAEYSILYSWVKQMGSQNGPFLCELGNEKDESMQYNVRRLSHNQYYNSLQDILSLFLDGSVTQLLLTKAAVSYRTPKDTGEKFDRTDSQVHIMHMKAYMEIANDLVAAISANPTYVKQFVDSFLTPGEGGCQYSGDVNSLSPACQQQLVRNFLYRTFRRPPQKDDQIDEVGDYLSSFSVNNTSQAIDEIVFRALVSPQFLFSPQLDQKELAEQPGIRRLSSYGIASRLSYAFWNRMPSGELMDLASSKDLFEPLAFEEALEIIFSKQSPRGGLSEFVSQWIGIDEPSSRLSSSPKFDFITQGVSVGPQLDKAMLNESAELFGYVVANNEKFPSLLTSDISFARHPDLMKIYGQGSPAPLAVTNENAVRFPAGERSGLLTRAAFLQSKTDTENPVMRGVHIRKDLLCLEIGDPPPDAPTTIPEEVDYELLSTREKYDHLTQPAQCISCHRLINPLGNAFSQFNAIGAFQQFEPIFDFNDQQVNQLPTNPVVNLDVALGMPIEVNNAIEFSEALAKSSDFRKCTSRKLFQYVYNTTQVDTDKVGCSLNKMYSNTDETGRWKDFLKSSAGSYLFKTRKVD